MNSAERRQQIMAHICRHGSGKVDDFVEHYNVSAVTIRHDLNLLEKKAVFSLLWWRNTQP